jgi:hypothetical protein
MISEWVQSIGDAEMVGWHWRWTGIDIHCKLRCLQVSPKDIATMGRCAPIVHMDAWKCGGDAEGKEWYRGS